MDIQFNKVSDTNNLEGLKSNWQKTLVAPQDGMWEALTDYAQHWSILQQGQIIGYACVNDENTLLQFYLSHAWLTEGLDILNQFILQQNINTALVGTQNPHCLSIVLQAQKSVRVHTYLFTDFEDVKNTQQEGNFRMAESKDLHDLIDFCHVSMGGPKEWLKHYLGNLISRNEIFLLEKGEEILGTCEVRKSDSDPQVSDVGMVVSASHRRKGLGTFLLGRAKKIAIESGRNPICSCEAGNIGSLKSIHKNGFRSVYQMLSIKF